MKKLSCIFSPADSDRPLVCDQRVEGGIPGSIWFTRRGDHDYFTYIINQLKEKKILLQKSIDKTDEVYQEWQSGTISAQEYLNHAIAQNWIDITQFTIDEKYSDSTEIYDALCDYIMDDIATDTGFPKLFMSISLRQDLFPGNSCV